MGSINKTRLPLRYLSRFPPGALLLLLLRQLRILKLLRAPTPPRPLLGEEILVFIFPLEKLA
jgi:hypothetical protein